MCCANSAAGEIYAESLQLESRTYRANSIPCDKFLESIQHVNSKIQEEDEMDKINELLNKAESRIDTSISLSKPSPKIIKTVKKIPTKKSSSKVNYSNKSNKKLKN